MTETYLLIAVLLVNVAIIVALFRRKNSIDAEMLRPLIDGVNAETRRVESSLRDEFTRQRGEMGRDATALREEVNGRLREFGESNDTRLTRLRGELNEGAGQATTDPAATTDALRAALEPKGLAALNYAEATDQNGFVVSQAKADEFGLAKISDLAKPAAP